MQNVVTLPCGATFWPPQTRVADPTIEKKKPAPVPSFEKKELSRIRPSRRIRHSIKKNRNRIQVTRKTGIQIRVWTFSKYGPGSKQITRIRYPPAANRKYCARGGNEFCLKYIKSIEIVCGNICQGKPWYLYLDGNLKIGAHARSNLYCFICLRHLIKPRAVRYRIFSPKKSNFLHTCATFFQLPSNIGTTGIMEYLKSEKISFNVTKLK